MSSGQGEGQPLAAKIQRLLDGDYKDVRDEARSFAKKQLSYDDTELPMADHRDMTVRNVKAIAEAGYASWAYPKEYGGQDRGKDYLNFVEILSHGDLSTIIKQGVNFGLFGLSVERLGTEKHKAGFLPEIMKGELLGGFAMTEIDGGSNVQGLQTEAVYDKESDSFILNTPHEGARKSYIGNAAMHGQMMVVFAQLKMSEDAESEGVHAFLVPIRELETNKVLPGVDIEDQGKKVGLNGVDNGIISFNNVKVPRDMLLNRYADVDAEGTYTSDIESKAKRFFTMIGTLVTGRIFVSLSSLSASKNALSLAVKNADGREVFGERLLDMQSTQHNLFPRLAEAYALHFATRDLIEESNNLGTRSLETKAAALKSRASDFAFETIDVARRSLGGQGYIAKHRLGLMRDDVDIYRTFEGDNTVLRLFTAKNLLDELKTEFASTSTYRRFLKGLSMEFKRVAVKYDPEKLNTSYAHMTDPAFYVRMLKLREDQMRVALGRKVMKLKRKLGGTKAAFDACQEDAMALSEAYTSRLMAEKFVEQVQAQEDPEVMAALRDLSDLFGVSELRKNAQWYLENSVMGTAQTHKLARLEHLLSQRVRENAGALVDGFAIPEALQVGVPETNIRAELEKQDTGPLVARQFKPKI